MFPVAEVEVTVTPMHLPIPVDIAPEPSSINELLNQGLNRSPAKRFGLIPGTFPNEYVGEASGIGGESASSYYTFPFGLYRSAPNHELSHTLGNPHAVTDRLIPCRNRQGVIIPGSALGACGACMRADRDLFPYSVNSQPTLGLMPAAAADMIFGLDLSDGPDSPSVIDPNSVYELMGYCVHDRYGAWTSSWTYSHLWSALINAFGERHPPSTLTRSLQAVRAVGTIDSLILRGTANLWAGTVQFGRISRAIQLPALPETAPGSHRLRLLDGGGRLRTQLEFGPVANESEAPEPSSGSFLVAVPFDPLIRAAEVTYRGVTLARAVASPGTPTVHVDFPNGGEHLGTTGWTMRWTAGDRDGDRLTYDILVTWDGGIEWTTLQTDWPDTHLELAANSLRGSGQALVRVVASDGFNTAVDTSDTPFTIVDQAPRISILSPTENQIVTLDQQMVLKAFARDPEEGRLNGTNIVWTSDRDGRLGTGPMLSDQTSSLHTGVHVIAATAYDNTGHTNAATVHLIVQTGAPVLYADLRLEMTVDPVAPVLGGLLALILNVQNLGRDSATDVRLTSDLPVGVEWVATKPSQGAFEMNGNQIVCKLGTLTNRQQISVTTVVSATNQSMLSFTASVAGLEPDPLPGNNTAQVRLSAAQPPSPAPDLFVRLSQVPEVVSAGQEMRYLIEFGNHGNAPASQVQLTNRMGDSGVLVSAQPSQGTVHWSGGNLVVDVGVLAPDERGAVDVTWRPASADTLFQQAQIRGAEADANEIDNLSTAITQIEDTTRLDIRTSANGVEVSWAAQADLVIEQSDLLPPAAQWTAITQGINSANGRSFLQIIPDRRTRSLSLAPALESRKGVLLAANLRCVSVANAVGLERRHDRLSRTMKTDRTIA